MGFAQGREKAPKLSPNLLFGAIILLITVLPGCSISRQHSTTPRSAADAVRARMAPSDTVTLDFHSNPPGINSIPMSPPVLPSPNLVMTPEVERELKAFLGRERLFIQRAIERRDQHMPMLEEIFRDEGIPEEFLSLAIIESGYNSEARSPVGAVGMWQFMRTTARMYGLRVDRKEDQRRDPILSTIAAARLLRDLYFYHGDWQLALAAYNAGSSGVTRALTRADCDNYWTLIRKRKLTDQTRRFVPRFIAAALIARGMKLGNNLSQLAKSFGVKGYGDDGVEVADWSGNRYTSAG